MARGRRKTFDEKIAAIDAKIADLNQKRKELLAAKEQVAVQQLLDAARMAGKTPVELVAELTTKF